MTKVTLLAIDVAKNVFQLHGIDEDEGICNLLRTRLTRNKLSEFVAKIDCTIVRRLVAEQIIRSESLKL